MNGADFNRLEKKEAKIDGARVVKNSGRNHERGDAALPDWLIDYKFNSSQSFSITRKNWDKHKKDAWQNGRRNPVIKVIFDDNTKLAVVEWDTLKEFIDQMAELDLAYEQRFDE